MKENKYGCCPKEDVCLKHDQPLIFQNFCEESPDIVDYVKTLRKHDMEELIKMNNDYFHGAYEGTLSQLIKDYYK